MLTKRRESTADSKSALKTNTDEINRDINGRAKPKINVSRDRLDSFSPSKDSPRAREDVKLDLYVLQ